MATQYLYHSPASYSHSGTAPAQGVYSGMIAPGKNGGFSFRKRYERVDWRKIAAVDIDHISRTLDFNTLQENIMNITYCNIESEMDLRMIDPNFVKLFKLGQLTIEYLLHSQEYLAGIVASLEEKAKKEHESHDETKKDLEKLTRELANIKQESHKRKKLLMAQQQLIHSGSANYVKCPYCPKAFLNNSYLQNHIHRRHADGVSSKPSSQDQHSGSANQSLLQELQEIKDRLRQTESELQHERKTLQVMKRGELDIAPVHGDEFREEHKRDMDEVYSMFMKEMKEMNEKYMASERALAEMEQRQGKRSNLGVIEDDVDNEKELLRAQREEVSILKENLQQQMVNMENQMMSKFEKQERKWQKKVQHMIRQHGDEVKQLNDALEKSSKVLNSSGRVHSPVVQQQQKEVEELLKKSREQEKILAEEEEKLEKEVMLSSSQTPRQRKMGGISPNTTPVTKMSMFPSDEEEETLGTGTGTGSASPLSTGRGTLRSTMGTTGEMSLRTTQFLEHLRKNPTTLSEMRGELSGLVDEQIRKNGINQTSLGDQVFASKMAQLRIQRNSLITKYPDFIELRRIFDRKAEEQAREKLRLQKRSPPPAARHFPPSTISHAPATRSMGSSGQHPIVSTAPQPRNDGFNTSPARPKPAPRASNTQKTLQSTGSTEYTSTQWDSDSELSEDDSLSRDVKRLANTPVKRMQSPTSTSRAPIPQARSKSPAQPSPRPRVIQSKPLSNQNDDWDSDSESIGRRPTTITAPQNKPTFIMSQSKGQNVNQLARSIESQLTNRKQTEKPFGGVDTMGSSTSKKAHSDILEDFDEDSDWQVSPVEDESPGKKSSASKRPSVKSSHDTDVSSNTYGTSVWGSSSKAASTVKPDAKRPGSRSSFVSITDVSSDEELDLENI